MQVLAVVPLVFPGPFPRRDSTPAQLPEIEQQRVSNLQEDVWKITNAAQPCAVAQAGRTALKPGQWAGSCNAIRPWQQRSLTLFLHITELPDSLHIPPCLWLPWRFRICGAFQLSLHFALTVTNILSPPSFSVPMYLFSTSLLFFLISLILPDLSILPRLRAKAVPVLEGDNGCQDPAVRAAANWKTDGSWDRANYEARTVKLAGQKCPVCSQRQIGACFQCWQVTWEKETHQAVDSFTILAMECCMWCLLISVTLTTAAAKLLWTRRMCSLQWQLRKSPGWFQGLHSCRAQAG